VYSPPQSMPRTRMGAISLSRKAWES